MASNATDIAEAFSLRIPPRLKDRIHQNAKANRRSLNAEMLVLMEQALAKAELQQGEAA